MHCITEHGAELKELILRQAGWAQESGDRSPQRRLAAQPRWESGGEASEAYTQFVADRSFKQ